jgi:vitamin-K-epoxide reductase (warfarin-sensitive)
VQFAVTELTAGTRVLFVFIAALSLAGVMVASLSLARHYATSATGFCEIGESFSCDIVNRSEYSTIEDIPVAAIGIAGYLGLFALSSFLRSRKATPNRLLATALAGLAFALYLTYIEKYRLMTWCILCLASQLLILLIAVLAILVKWKTAKA